MVFGPRLSPRGSFSEWVETVRGRAAPWLPYERDVAVAFGRDIQEVALTKLSEFERARDIMLALQSPEAEARARFIAERLFTLAAAGALARSAPEQITEAYALTRLAHPSRMMGANDLGAAVKPLLDRAFVTI